MTALSLLILPLGVIGPWQWVIIALVIILLFGGKKIPELMRGMGKSVKSFKDGMNGLDEPSQSARSNGSSEKDEKKEGEK